LLTWSGWRSTSSPSRDEIEELGAVEAADLGVEVELLDDVSVSASKAAFAVARVVARPSAKTFPGCVAVLPYSSPALGGATASGAKA